MSEIEAPIDPKDYHPADPRLGRLPVFDERSRQYPVRALLAATLLPRSYTWRVGANFNQGSVGACVGFSVTHELRARPVEKRLVGNASAMQLYLDAQKIDPWPGESYEGTSVLAGIKIAQQQGYNEYRRAFGIDDLILALGYKGPAVLGINWYSGMFAPSGEGIIKPTGSVAGGHAILANGISLSRGLIRLHNSWGASWGIADNFGSGQCFISIDDLRRLLSEDGEACIPVKRA